jgi:hypothetical protein
MSSISASPPLSSPTGDEVVVAFSHPRRAEADTKKEAAFIDDAWTS